MAKRRASPLKAEPTPGLRAYEAQLRYALPKGPIMRMALHGTWTEPLPRIHRTPPAR